MAQQPTSSALRALALEYKSLQEEPVEGFRVKLVNEDNLFEWEVAIFGPPDTLYQGGYFKVSCIKWKLASGSRYYVLNLISNVEVETLPAHIYNMLNPLFMRMWDKIMTENWINMCTSK